MKLFPKTVLKNYKRTFLYLLLTVFAFLGRADAQGCECTNCSGPITPNTTDTYVINISGASNNSLGNSNQGVCGVFLDFNANHVFSLVITLTSPSGQTVTLVGPYDNSGGNTIFGFWDISFLACSETVMPDQSPIPYNNQWTNLQLWGSSNYTGSYYPYIGCLEDFNTGPVNGNWTLTVQNGFANNNSNTGNFSGFSLLFCDDNGTGCGNSCSADAGDLSGVNDIAICENDNFNGNISPFYGVGGQPSNQYSYDYIISQNGAITSYETNPDFPTYAVGTYEVCGLSFLTDDAGNIPSPNGSLSVADLENQLNNSPPFCGDISDDCFMVEILAYPDTVFIQDGFCQGTSYDYRGNMYNMPGVYYVTLPASDCDTTVELTLSEIIATSENIAITICQGDTFFIANNFYTTSGNYPNTLTSSFGCDSTINLDLTVLNPESNIAPTTNIDCANMQLVLDGSTSTSGTGVTYLWTTSTGSIVGNPTGNMATVDEEGKYYLTTTITQNGVTCSDTDSITVTSNIEYPEANAGIDSTLNCAVIDLRLDGSGSDSGGFSYNWTTDDGMIGLDGGTLNPVITAPGTYVLNVTNQNNNCVTQDTIVITIDTIPPVANAGASMEINCLNAQVQLDGTGSSQGIEFTYQWSTSNGNILLGENTLMPTVDSAGMYQLLVTDTSNHCTTTDEVTITIDTIPPIADAGNDISLNCAFPQTQIDATNSSQGNNFTYQWSVLSGSPLVDGAATLTPTVDGFGEYELQVTNDLTGCTSTSQVTVNQDFVNPSIVIEMPINPITCSNPIIEINAGNSSTGNDFEYLWTVIGSGNIDSGADGLFPQINEAGSYELLITNTQNGCTVLDTVEVFANNTLPNVDAGVDSTIDCTNLQIVLNGSGATGGNIEYQWTEINSGNTVTIGGNTLTPTIDAAGDYELLITNTQNGCTQTDTTTISIDMIPPIADIGIDTSTLNCFFPEITLNASNSSMGDFAYLWSTSNGTTPTSETTLQPTISASGNYELLVTNNQNGCTSIDSIVIVENFATPIADAGIDTFLTCSNPTILLNGNDASMGSNSTYAWIEINGVPILNGQNTLQPEINAEGTYQLTITNSISGCESMDEVIVTQDSNLPIANAGEPDTINCIQSTVTLDGNNSSMSNEIDYEWTTVDGHFVNGENTLTPEVDSSGMYVLTVTNTQNGCASIDSVAIAIDSLLPFVDAGIDTAFTCVSNMLALNGSAVQGNNFTYNWTTSGIGNISDPSILNPIIDAEGIYQLEVTNSLNGCMTTDEVEVVWDTIAPIADAGMDTILNCDIANIVLGGNSSVGNDIEYLWTTTIDGNILSNPTNAMISINSGAIYTLVVTDTGNSCSATDEVEVIQDANLPIAIIEVVDTVECGITTITLDASNSSMGNDFSYEWTTVDGNIISDTFSLFPTIAAAGIYTLTVFNNANQCESTAFVDIVYRNCTPVAEAGTNAEIDCDQPFVILDGTGSSTGSDFTYEWTTVNGNIVSDTFSLFPTVDAAGIYILTVENTLFGITAMDSVLVTESFATPSVVLVVNDSLDCSGNNVLVSSAGSSSGSNFTYSWSTTDGNITSIVGITNIQVNQSGFYFLEITNDDNGCVAIDSIEVIQNVDVPLADAGIDLELNCYNSQYTIDASNSSMGNNITYAWSTDDGNIISGADSLMPIIDSVGVYVLEVTNTDNGCISLDSIMVTENLVAPIADAGNPDTLTCFIDTLSLDGSGSIAGNDIIYSWSTTDGNILLGENTLTPQVDSAGTYELIVINNLNGCQDTSSVTIDSNFTAPIADAGIDMTLDCGVSNIMLDGSNSSMGGNFDYQWTTIDGNIQSDSNTLTPQITLGGTYILTVQNLDNGCTAVDSTTVSIVNCSVSVSILLPDTLTCIIDEVTLDGSNSSDWQTIIYEWTPVGTGNITGPTDAAITTVDEPGDYQLTITDTQTGNTAFGVITVIIDDEKPLANAGLSDTLNCNVSQIMLDGSASDQGVEFQYQWNSAGGNLIMDENSLTPTITVNDTYELVVTNNETGCTNNSFVVIEIDTILPIANIAVPMNLTCVDTLVNLEGLGSSTGNDFTYQWSPTGGGNIVSGDTGIIAVANAVGTYELLVLNTRNFCKDSTSIDVSIDTLAPMISIETPEVLTCDLLEIDLDASSSSNGNNFSYTWQTLNGNIVNDGNTLTPSVDSAGEYILTILNFDNGCFSTENITVLESVDAPFVDAGNTVELTCVDTLLSLDGSGSASGNQFLYQWNTINGNIVNGDNTIAPNINLPGEYELVVTNANNMCTSNSFVQVTQNITPPVAIIEMPDTLNCGVEEITINANNSSNGLTFSYLWSTDNGNIEFGENTLTPQVNDGGDFILTILDMENGCTTAENIEVFQDTLAPLAEAGMEMTLTCLDTILVLSGNGSSEGGSYNYTWTTDFGNILFDENTLTPSVDELGNYEIEVINNNNQCTSTDIVQVFEDITPPVIDINAIGGLVLNCDNNTVVLDASSSLPLGNVTYEWNTPNGNILSGNSVANPEINLAGEYYLTLTSNLNGCIATEMVAITDDFEAPIVNILSADILTCVDTVMTLSGQGSSQGNNIEYTWTTATGNITSITNEIECIINAPGTYVLTVLNTENGCASSDSILVLENINAPNADAGGAYEFDCIQDELTLQATASQGNEFTYQWSTFDGNIVTGINTLQPTVNAFGTYILTVTNNTNGCTTISSAIVTEDLDTPQGIEVDFTLPLCYGDANGGMTITNVIGGEPPYQYAIDNQSFSLINNFSMLAAGSYLISIKDDSGCEYEELINLPQPDQVFVDLGEDQFLELGESTILEAVTNISPFELDTAIWTQSSGTLDCENCLEHDITPLNTSGYTVFLTNENGCSTTDTVIVYVNNKRRIYIPNAFTPDGDGINDKLLIYGGVGVEEVEKFQIFSRWGELVFEENNFQPNDETRGWNGVFNGKKMNTGVFIFYAKIKYINGETEVIKGDILLQ